MAQAGYPPGMSDIAIRLDGLLLAAILIVTAVVFLFAALGYGIAAIGKPAGARARRIAGRAAILLAVNAAAFALLLWYFEQPRPEYRADAPDWLDWLSAPWLLFFLAAGIWALRPPRTKPEPGAAHP
jgi:cytochrome bd-type quinol oxidase subunit 2